MRKRLGAALLLGWAGVASAAPGPQNAQSFAGPQDATVHPVVPDLPGSPARSTTADDPGRPQNVDVGGLSGRGGPNAAGTGNSFSATIGSRIGGAIGSSIGSRLPSSQR